jgi:uncharacterized delta-60 repeat protein
MNNFAATNYRSVRRTSVWRMAGMSFIGIALATVLQGQSGDVNTGFFVGAGANNRVFSMAAQSNGEVLIGGAFTSYGGVTVGRLARLSRSGVLDPGFGANIGTGAGGQVNVIHVDAEGRILVGGSFTTFNGQSARGIVRLNNDGTMDTGFNAGSGINAGAVTCIAVRPDGRILLGGTFTAFNGVATGRVVQLGADGTHDMEFSIGPGASSDVYSISLDAQGRLLVGGAFSTYDGQSRPALARILTDGSVDPTFEVGLGFNQAVFKCIHQDDGRILVGGQFTTYQGVSAARIVRLRSDGARDEDFTIGSGFNSWVYSLSIQGDGKILAGGNFTTYDGLTANRFVRLNTNGALDADLALGSGFNNWVYDAAWQPDGTVAVVGGFTTYKGAAYNRVISLSLGCEQELGLSIRTDAFGSQTSWEITGEGFDYTVCSGSGYSSSTDIQVACCVPNGCFRFRLFDSGGDGMAAGGYTLRDGSGERILDNSSRGSFTTESSMSDNAHFCLPMSEQQAIFTSRDKLDWAPTNYIVATENAEVTAEWGVGDQTDDGYEFWFFDPNGSYSVRRFRDHATSDGFGAGASRACHLRLFWSGAIPSLPQFTLLNLRIRARVNGENGQWGPACRLMIDPVAASCPYSKLMDIPGHPLYSCGVTRTRSQMVTAKPVRGANRYQFEFTNTALGYQRTITSTGYNLRLNWASNPLMAGNVYVVRVRVSRNGGLTWCNFGDECTVTIAASSSMGEARDELGLKSRDVEQPELTLWPNPSDGRQVNVILSDNRDEDDMQLIVHDYSGRLVHQQRITPGLGGAPGMIQFANRLPNGQYILRIVGGEHQLVERLVVAY